MILIIELLQSLLPIEYKILNSLVSFPCFCFFFDGRESVYQQTLSIFTNKSFAIFQSYTAPFICLLNMKKSFAGYPQKTLNN
ncbi:hypothetical protein BD847_2158 [Flavobacterium cutihirudinis]|uniref:Uncharacterized protein n=1 Tax=Flavobacterium cutihirudinis TaxID=1265740 RepID=A0A3D9FXC2_9FLAO|nr:hypothetical protein BD847_2158 [Flavobacterium cutihirudinis]